MNGLLAFCVSAEKGAIMDNIVYVNGFSVAMSALETQINLRCDSPIIDKESGAIIGVNLQVVADVRMNPKLARELCEKLSEQLDAYDDLAKDNTNE